MIRFSYILAGLGVGIYAIPPVRRRFDEKIFKHVRNYGATLGQWNKFNTQEEFYEMLTNVGGGVTTFFSDWLLNSIITSVILHPIAFYISTALKIISEVNHEFI